METAVVVLVASLAGFAGSALGRWIQRRAGRP